MGVPVNRWKFRHGMDLGHYRRIGNTGDPKNLPVALDFRGGAHGLGVVVRELDRRTAVDLAQLADEADRVEAIVAMGIAIAKIVGQQCSPASTEANAPIGTPAGIVKKIAGMPETRGFGSVTQRTPKVGMQREDDVDVE